jgi:hypothetical protein
LVSATFWLLRKSLLRLSRRSLWLNLPPSYDNGSMLKMNNSNFSVVTWRRASLRDGDARWEKFRQTGGAHEGRAGQMNFRVVQATWTNLVCRRSTWNSKRRMESIYMHNNMYNFICVILYIV